MIELVLPFPPSINHYWRHVGPRVLISRRGRAYREQVRAILAAAGVRPIAGPLEVYIAAHPPDLRRRDLDNLLKSLLDSGQYGGAYHDDSQIVKLTIEKHAPVPGGRAIVHIKESETCPMDCGALPESSTTARTERSIERKAPTACAHPAGNGGHSPAKPGTAPVAPNAGPVVPISNPAATHRSDSC